VGAIFKIDRVLYGIVGLIVGGALVWFGLQSFGSYLGLSTGGGQEKQAAAAPTEFLAGPMLRTVGANQYVEQGGVGFRVNSLEIYADGIALTYSVIPPRAATGRMSLVPDSFEVYDNAAGVYLVREDLSAASVGPYQTRGYLTLTPTVSAGVKSVTVKIQHMTILGTAGDGQSKVLEGPWQIEIPLS
jgi:hypothetical protein